MSLFEKASLIVTPNAYKESKLHSIKPTDGSGDLTVVRATTAPRVNSSSIIESVAVNVPRLDYTNSTCPSILVEPQRTNLALNSQSFIPSWSTTPQTNGLIEPTSTIDPQGFTNAVRITNVSGGGTLGRIFTIVPGTTYTSSIWVRRVTGTGVVELVDLNGGSISLNLTNKWQKFSVTSTAVSIGRFYIRATIIGNSIEVWGAQLEAGSNATSYIPTTSATITRNEDVISKTGISSLIGQTEGTIFIDFNNQLLNSTILCINKNSTNSVFLNTSLSGILSGRIYANSIDYLVSFSGYTTFNEKIKMCLKYGSFGIKLFINGQLKSTNVNPIVFTATLSSLNLNDGIVLNANSTIRNNGVLVFPTALTDIECIQLTTL